MSGNTLSEKRKRWSAQLAHAVSVFMLIAAWNCAHLNGQSSEADPSPTRLVEEQAEDKANDESVGKKPEAQAKRRLGELTLINGNQLVGSIDPTEEQGFVSWQAPEFLSPFQFRLESIESVKFPIRDDMPPSQGAFAIELVNGDTIQGDVLEWTAESVLIKASFGLLRVRTEALSRIYRMEDNPTLVFAGLDGLRALVADPESPWQEEGNQLWTGQTGAELNGNLHVPSKAVIEVQLSFSSMPNFVFAMGTDVDAQRDTVTDGWRLETFGGKLAIVKETEERADVALVTDLTLRRTVRLLLYLDQEEGTLQVFQPDGQQSGEIRIPAMASADDAPQQGGIRVINRGDDLRIERLRVSRWSGDVPGKVEPGQATIAYSDGSFDSATVIGKQSGSNLLQLQTSEGLTEVDWSRVIGIKPSAPKPPVNPAKCAIFLMDSIRISGTLENIDQTHWTINGDNLLSSIKIPRNDVRSFVVFEHNTVEESPQSEGRLGRLEISGRKLTGRLDPRDEKSAKGSGLYWHPFGSRNSAELLSGASGRITYRDQAKVDSTSAAARALAMQRLRLQQQKRGLNFGQLFLRRADQQKTGEIKRDAHVLHVRSGDVINCRIESIDERGVHLTSLQSEGGFVPHENMKAIEFVANAPPPDLVAAKRERLLTIPRLQKAAPPTHLLCSHNGDFLRCRLTNLDGESIRAEVQLEELEIPRSRVAQIVWFHPDESESNDDDDPLASETSSDNPDDGDTESEDRRSVFAGRVQVLRNDGRRMTFRPVQVTERTIEGESEILGRCNFNIAEIDQLIIGDQIADEVAELAYNKWRLQPAVEPLVTAAMEGNGPMASGTASTLIGKPAPEVKLEQLDGSQFQLSACKGQIVVLDFWATWCAPCMQTMPLVEEAIAEYDPERVRLVSINLEEPAEQIRSVLDRHELNLTVALDRDGVAAQRYEARAIPQLVIVGTDGVVERLFVGGGSGVVEQMKAAIDELLQ